MRLRFEKYSKVNFNILIFDKDIQEWTFYGIISGKYLDEDVSVLKFDLEIYEI